MKIRTIIVEDEPLARERLGNLLESDPEIEVVAECGDGRTAVTAVQEHRPDLLFLDIQLPERNGFEVLADLGASRPPAIVFVTAYDRFAVKAFEVHAVDYLLKPFDIDRFEQALARAKTQLRPRESAATVAAPPAPRNKRSRNSSNHFAHQNLPAQSASRSSPAANSFSSRPTKSTASKPRIITSISAQMARSTASGKH
jgi:two-component system LytT family response regulator